MKKISISLMTTAMLLALHAHDVDAASLKASDLKIGVKSYEAVLTKDAKVLDNDNAFKSNAIKVFKKNKKVTVVERAQIHGYDYLVLKGDYMLPLNNSGIKIIKAVPGKIKYAAYHPSKDAKTKIANAPKSSSYYKAYKNYVLKYEKSVYYSFNLGYRDITTTMYMHMKPEERGGLGGGSRPTMTYKEWMEEKDYTNYKAEKGFTCYAEDIGPKSVNILSDSFIKEYFSNNRNFKEFKVGKEAPNSYQHCSVLGTDAGNLTRMKDVSIKSVKGSYAKIKEIFIAPMKKYTYNDIISHYGKPSSTRFIANGRVEHQLIYNHTKNNGYKVVVALDNYKGNVKYLRKMND